MSRDLVFYLATFAAWQTLMPVSLVAQDAALKNSAVEHEAALFRGLLRSLSIQRRTDSTSAQSPTPAVQQGSDLTTAILQSTPVPAVVAPDPGDTLRVKTPGLGGGLAADAILLGICPDCGSLLRGGICSSATTGIRCNGGSRSSKGANDGRDGGSNGGSVSTKLPDGLAAASGGGDATSAPGLSPNSPRPTKPSLSARESISGAQAEVDRRKNSTRFSPSGQDASDAIDITAQMNVVNTIASRASAAIGARQRQASGNISQDPNGLLETLPAIIDSVNAAAASGPGLRWKVVKPAGIDPSATRSAVSLETGQTDDSGDQRKSFTLDTGVFRSALTTGPENPLLVPPGVASIVYVVDCSGSMAGSRFTKVAAALADAIAQMNANQQFAVLLFNNLALQIDDGGLLPATDANKSLVASQLSQVMPVGGTDPTDALFIAVQMKPETIVVLSDGEFDEQIVQGVTRLNRTSGANCQINCVGISSSVSVLRALAALNGPGNYIESP